MPYLETCLSPAMLHLHPTNGKVVVVTDVYRATSCMVAGLAKGIREIVPVAEPEQALALKSAGYLAAGERNGEKLPGFNMGNSPFEFMDAGKQQQKVAMTTTNGTRAIQNAQGASRILIGALLNVDAVATQLQQLNQDVLLLCAGWKDKFSLEDTLFCGALAHRLHKTFQSDDDATFCAINLYQKAENQLPEFLQHASHARRLSKLGITEDLNYCAQTGIFGVVPYFDGQRIVVA